MDDGLLIANNEDDIENLLNITEMAANIQGIFGRYIRTSHELNGSCKTFQNIDMR